MQMPHFVEHMHVTKVSNVTKR